MPTAYVLINTDIGYEQNLLSHLRKLSKVEKADIVMGEYDVIATISCDTMSQLKSCINNEVRYLDNVKSTLTLMAA
jgi:DNA-binding Lrp family transcriptional regulator